MSQEFPKALYLKGDPSSHQVFVENAEQQTEYLEKGYKMLKDAPLPEPARGNGITPDVNAVVVKDETIEGTGDAIGAQNAQRDAANFLDRNVADIRENLGALTDEQLDSYRQVEASNRQRPTLLAAIDAEIAHRAEQGAGKAGTPPPSREPATTPDAIADDTQLESILDGTVDEVVSRLDALSDAELSRLAEIEADEDTGKGRKGVADAVSALQAKRAAE